MGFGIGLQERRGDSGGPAPRCSRLIMGLRRKGRETGSKGSWILIDGISGTLTISPNVERAPSRGFICSCALVRSFW
jgi:hypothetical protein